jgi:hypothetical protein
MTVNTLPLQQLGHLALLYFPAALWFSTLSLTFQRSLVNLIVVEKFCSRHGMVFGLPQDKII